MAQRVVDLLEPVEVHEQHREVVTRLLRWRSSAARDLVRHHQPVGQQVRLSVRALSRSCLLQLLLRVTSTIQATAPAIADPARRSAARH
jgi:hypothetical protein